MMWVVINITRERAAALRSKELLEKEGLSTEICPIARKRQTGIIEIRVLESEALEARERSTEHGML